MSVLLADMLAVPMTSNFSKEAMAHNLRLQSIDIVLRVELRLDTAVAMRPWKSRASVLLADMLAGLVTMGSPRMANTFAFLGPKGPKS